MQYSNLIDLVGSVCCFLWPISNSNCFTGNSKLASMPAGGAAPAAAAAPAGAAAPAKGNYS